MASNVRVRCFANPVILRRIARPLLVQFFQPFRDFLAGRGVALVNDDRLSYDGLANALMALDENTPDEMLDAMYFVDEMSLPPYYDDLLTEAHAAGIDLGASSDIAPADLAVRIWLADRNILERLHAERFLVKPKSFQCFLSSAPTLPDVQYPADAVLEALENDLNDWFETKKRGRGTRAFPFFREDGIWFLVRHGEPLKREGTLENGEPASIFYRPEKFDVLIYDHQVGELAIHAGTKGEKQTYCRLFGKHIFGSADFFAFDGMTGKYTLQPIRRNWQGCVACKDVEGMEDVRLTDIQWRHDSDQYHVEGHRADDVFRALDDINRQIPDSAKLLRATFKVKFKNAVRPRTVAIRPPNVAIFDRESDSAILEEWMAKREFILPAMGAKHVHAEAVLAVP
jgi:hypothetical protein